MRKILFLPIFLLPLLLLADMPGAKARPPLYLKIENSKSLKDYTLFYCLNENFPGQPMHDSLFYVPGGRGRPSMIYIWAKSNIDSLPNSDTLSYWGGSENRVLRIESVTNRKLLVSSREFSKKEMKKIKKSESGFGLVGDEDDGSDMMTWLLISASLSGVLLFLLVLRRRRMMPRA